MTMHDDQEKGAPVGPAGSRPGPRDVLFIPARDHAEPTSENTHGLDDPASWQSLPDELELGPEALSALSHRPGGGGPRALALVAVRESDGNDMLMLEMMLRQTLSYCKHLPGVERVLEWGLNPLIDPESLKGEIEVIQIRLGKTKAALFEVEGVLYLISAGTAAGRDVQGDNAYTQILCKTIMEHRPRTLHAANMPRLVRSYEQGGLLLHAVSGNVDEIQLGTMTIPLTGPNAEIGKQMFNMFTTVAAGERNHIVQRLTCGLASKYLRGEWVQGEGSLPPMGYLYDEEAGNLRLDMSQAQLVRDCLTLLADPSIPNTRLVRDLGRAGLTSRTLARKNGGNGNVSTVANADSYVRNLFRWAPLFGTGKWTVRVLNPFPGVDRYGDLKVEGMTDDHPGYLVFRYDLGVPMTGWADDSVLLAIRERYKAMHDRGSDQRAPRTAGLPLVGTQWSQGANHYRISNDGENYSIRHQVAEDAHGAQP